MHLGVLLPNYDREASPEAVARVAVAAEQSGYDSIWTTEHVLAPPEIEVPYGRVFEPLLTLAWVASSTRRVLLGTSVVVVPTHNPIRLANQAATLQIYSGGRFALGVGVGWAELEFRALGMPFEDRGARFDEALRLMQSLWAGQRSFAGKYWSFEDMRFGPLPEPHPPEFWVGGTGPASIRRAVELAGTWHPNWLTPDDIRSVVSRSPGLRVIPRLEINLTDVPPRADLHRRSRPIGGDTATVTAKLQEYLDAGVAGFVVGLGTYEPERVVERIRHFADRVRPALKG